MTALLPVLQETTFIETVSYEYNEFRSVVGKLSYLVLDSCDEPNLWPEIKGQDPGNLKSLYSGYAAIEYANIAPYVARNSESLAKLTLEQMPDRAWGYYIDSTKSFPELCRFLKRFLTVKIPNGNQVFFRFYDPRVIVSFLAASESSIASLFFSQIERIFISYQGEYLGIAPVTSLRNERSTAQFDKGGLQIRQPVFDRMHFHVAVRYAQKVFPMLSQAFPQRWAAVSSNDAVRILAEATVRAERLGFCQEAETLRFLEILSIVGDDFGDDVAHQASLRLLRDPGIVSGWPAARDFVASIGRTA